MGLAVMNRLLSESGSVREACEALPREYLIVFELTNGPDNRTVYWQMRFDPEHGISFSLEAPDRRSDLCMRGAYAETIRYHKAAKDAPEGVKVEDPMVHEGDESVWETIGDAFARAQAVAAIETEFPHV